MLNPEYTRFRRATTIGLIAIVGFGIVLVVVLSILAAAVGLPIYVVVVPALAAVLGSALFFWTQKRKWPSKNI